MITENDSKTKTNTEYLNDIYSDENDAKADFDDVYDAPTPHSYIETMANTGYEIGQQCQPFFVEAVRFLQERNGKAWPVQMLDIGCSYGIGSALVKYKCTFDELVAFSATRVPRDYDSACQALRQWLNVIPPENDIRCVGLDCSKPAIKFAIDSGLLDGGLSRNLEEGTAPLTQEELQWFEGCNLMISMGAIGYISERTLNTVFNHLAKAHPGSLGPIAVMSVLRMFDLESIYDCFAKHGFVLREVPGICLPQRNFADETEKNEILQILKTKGTDFESFEAKGKLYANLLIAATPDTIDLLEERMLSVHAEQSLLKNSSSFIKR